MEVLVFGAGSLGSLVGGLLARTHDVTLVGRDPHVAAIRESGLRVSGAVETTTHPEATTDAEGHDADLAVVTVKSFDTATAADALATGAVDTVVSLQNGLTEETLADRLPDATVLAGAATYGADLRDPGHVACTGVGRVTLGPLAGGTDPAAERAGWAFRTGGVETLVATDMPRRRWAKLAVNAGINAVTALARVENGALAEGPAHEVATRAARETARVARREGVALSNRRAVDAVERVIDATADNRSSTRQDVEAGRRTEVEAIFGEVVARADRASRAGHVEVSVPTVRTLADLVRAWEVGAGVRQA